MHYTEIDTPALVIDRSVLENNIKDVQHIADNNNVELRPHTKTHKMSRLARMQTEGGAAGITVAKVGEAEVMAKNGLDDIFIANQIVGGTKLRRIRKLAETIDISFGIDALQHVDEIESVFEGSDKKAQVLVEIEVGENRSGVIEEDDFKTLLEAMKNSDNVEFKGVFSHDGHTYKAADTSELKRLYEESTNRTVHFGRLAGESGMTAETISIGSTPPVMMGFEIPQGVTEIRPGTYILMDAGQSGVIGTFDRVAGTVLTTIISQPAASRVITDVGAKGITKETRDNGITATTGLGLIKGYDGVFIDSVFDEHAIIYDADFSRQVEIGDKVRIIPNHICPVSNLHEKAYIVDNEAVVEEVEIDCRAKLK